MGMLTVCGWSLFGSHEVTIQSETSAIEETDWGFGESMNTSPNASLFSSSPVTRLPDELELEKGWSESNSTSNVSAPSTTLLGKMSSKGTGT